MELLFVFVLIAIGAICASTLFGVALGRAAARGDAELEDRRMRALAMRGRAIRVSRIGIRSSRDRHYSHAGGGIRRPPRVPL